MDRMLYIAMTGARQTLNAQALNNHNLANVNTTGFRADLAQFRAMPVFGDGHPSRVYAMAERPGLDTRPGMISTTGRELDVAVDGDGWIAVQAPDGQESYTRAGNLQLGPGGMLTTAAGHPVLGDGGPIAIPPADRIEIGADGVISVVPQGEAPTTLVEVERVRLVKPEAGELRKDEFGLVRTKDGQPAPPDASIKLVSGALETSNVNPHDALVNMIELARQFEMQIKMMKAAADNGAASDQLLRLE